MTGVADTGTDTAIPDDDDDDDTASRASQQSTSLQPSSLQWCPLAHLGLLVLLDVFTATWNLSQSSKIMACAQKSLQFFFRLERAIYGRCALVQSLPSALQLANRRKNARLLTDLIAVCALPPHHQRVCSWSDWGDDVTELNDIVSLTAAVR